MTLDPNPNQPLPEPIQSPSQPAKRDWLRLAAFIGVLLLVPLIPFVLCARQIETNSQQWLEQFSANPAALASAGFALLASDIFLPIPSSLVCTWLGQRLGWIQGATVSWAGLTCGNLIGLSLARLFGHWFVLRFADAKSVSQFQIWAERYGAWLIVLSRPLPLVSEAVLLGLGISSSIRWHWIGLVILCNLFMAIGWTGLGVAGQLASMEWLANAISVTIPMALLFVWRKIHSGN